MPTLTPDLARAVLGTATPQDAVAAFQQRGLLQPSFRWQDVYQEEHSAGFAVAGVAQLDILKLFQDELDQVVATGKNLADFAKVIKPQLVAKGFWGDVEVTDPKTGESRLTRFDDARLKLIYDVNLRQSHAAGRWKAAEASGGGLMMYRTMRDERVRRLHAQWDGLVLPMDHPFWLTHYPPNGWRCRCRAFQVSDRMVQRYRDDGFDIKTDPPAGWNQTVPFENVSTGEVVQVPVGIDPGFAYNPGLQRPKAVADLQRTALDSAPPPVASAQVQQALTTPNFSRFLQQPLPGERLPVAVLDAEAAAQAGLPARPAGASETRSVSIDSAGLTAIRAALADILPAADFALVQAAIDGGTAYPAQGDTVYVLTKPDQVVIVTIVVNTAPGAADTGPLLRGLRRLTPGQAAADPQLQRLQGGPNA